MRGNDCSTRVQEMHKMSIAIVENMVYVSLVPPRVQ
jgi:hypothetical protein